MTSGFCRSWRAPLVPPSDEALEVMPHEMLEEGDLRCFYVVLADLRSFVPRAPIALCDACYSEDEAKTRRAQLEREIAVRVRDAGVPEALRGYGWDDMWTQTKKRELAVVAAHVWASADPKDARGLYLWGPVGTGKTTLAAVAATHRLRRWPTRSRRCRRRSRSTSRRRLLRRSRRWRSCPTMTSASADRRRAASAAAGPRERYSPMMLPHTDGQVKVGGLPCRGRSSRPSKRVSKKRLRHFETTSRRQFSRAAIWHRL